MVIFVEIVEQLDTPKKPIKKPINNEPESPKKIFPEKIFINQNPKIEDDINNAKVKNVSLNSSINKPIAINDVIANPDASPFIPSIKFQAFITETISNEYKTK